jgi:hypothetical protein
MGRGYSPLSMDDWAKLQRANVVARAFPRGMVVPAGGGSVVEETPIPTPTPTPTPIPTGIIVNAPVGNLETEYQKSNDGINWSASTITAGGWESGAYGNDIFLLGRGARFVGQKFIYSDDGAETWSGLVGPSTSSRAISIAYSEYLNKFYITGNEQLTGHYTTDAINYSTYTKPNNKLRTLTSDEDNELLVFVHLFLSPFQIWTTYSGGTGTFVARQTISSGSDCVIRNRTLGLTFVFTATQDYYISTDSINWTGETNTGFSASTGSEERAAYRPSDGRIVWMFVNDTAKQFAVSDDGINWTTSVLPGSVVYRNVIYVEPISKFIAVNNDGDFAVSSDGINWTLETGAVGITDLRALVHGY